MPVRTDNLHRGRCCSWAIYFWPRRRCKYWKSSSNEGHSSLGYQHHQHGRSCSSFFGASAKKRSSNYSDWPQSHTYDRVCWLAHNPETWHRCRAGVRYDENHCRKAVARSRVSWSKHGRVESFSSRAVTRLWFITRCQNYWLEGVGYIEAGWTIRIYQKVFYTL